MDKCIYPLCSSEQHENERNQPFCERHLDKVDTFEFFNWLGVQLQAAQRQEEVRSKLVVPSIVAKEVPTKKLRL